MHLDHYLILRCLKMERVNEILNNRIYREKTDEINMLEKDRVFCRHDFNHFFDVARIALIICYEEQIEIDRGQIYAAALLHDIGRGAQYKEGIPHEIKSAEIAGPILDNCGYTKEETEIIIEAIREHGNEEVKTRRDLVGVLYRADKLSRRCFLCDAIEDCHKSSDKMNMRVYY